jgi:hypothetical protein
MKAIADSIALVEKAIADSIKADSLAQFRIDSLANAGFISDSTSISDSTTITDSTLFVDSLTIENDSTNLSTERTDSLNENKNNRFTDSTNTGLPKSNEKPKGKVGNK